ncbi:MAG: glycosyl hydrolase [Armatimonadota bacterium]
MPNLHFDLTAFRAAVQAQFAAPAVAFAVLLGALVLQEVLTNQQRLIERQNPSFRGASAQPEAPRPVTAARASDFLDSIGANSAVSVRGENLADTIKAVRYLGLRWIRSGYEGNLPVEDLIELHRQTGIRFSYGLLSGGTDIPRLLSGARRLAAVGALLAIEGNNEPNNWGIIYQGERGGRDGSWLPVAKLQRDLYQAVKSDPVLKKYPVWSISESGAQTDNVGLQFLTIPQGAGCLMPDGTKYADYANCHNYMTHPSWPGLHDNQTWIAADPSSACKVDGLYGNYGVTWLKKFRGYPEAELLTLPRVTTETGVTIEGPFTERVQALLYLSVYLAQFKRGWKHTAIYILRDRSDEAGNQSFGFYTKDYTPRTAAHYLHNFTTILADRGSRKQTGRLVYSISNQPETVHDLLLQKSDGTFMLVIWGERFIGGSDEVSVGLGRKFPLVRVYDPTIGTAPIKTLRSTDSLALTLSDHPLIIELKPGQ